jgi:hypothetical protein
MRKFERHRNEGVLLILKKHNVVYAINEVVEWLSKILLATIARKIAAATI